MTKINYKVINNTAHIELNNPKKLNALDLEMCNIIGQKLNEIKVNNDIKIVVISGIGEKAFCAGGDIKQIYYDLDKDVNMVLDFFKIEYLLNVAIGEFNKPIIALVDGITMGGGMGLSMHAKYRVATQRSKFAMPETAIGLFPDVGAGYFLNQIDQDIGLFLGVTGHLINGEEACQIGLCTNYCDIENKEALISDIYLCKNGIELDILMNQNLIVNKSLPNWCKNIPKYNKEITIVEYITSINKINCEELKATITKLEKASPFALGLSFNHLIRSRQKSLREVIKDNYYIVQSMISNSDFKEGVRALLIDKDHNPKWRYKNITTLNNNEITSYIIENKKENIFNN